MAREIGEALGEESGVTWRSRDSADIWSSSKSPPIGSNNVFKIYEKGRKIEIYLPEGSGVGRFEAGGIFSTTPSRATVNRDEGIVKKNTNLEKTSPC